MDSILLRIWGPKSQLINFPLTSLALVFVLFKYVDIQAFHPMMQRFFHVRQCVCIGGCQFAPGSQRADNAIHFDEGHFTKPSLHEKTHFYSL